MAKFAYHLGKRLVMEKPASKLLGKGLIEGGKRALPWLARQSGRLFGKAQPVIRQMPSAAQNWWQRASQFGKVPAPTWAMRRGPELGAAGAQFFGLTPEWMDPALNAYWLYRYPKLELASMGIGQLLPENAGAGKPRERSSVYPFVLDARDRKRREQYESGAGGANAAYLQAMAPQMGWNQPPPTPNYYSMVFGKPR